MDWIRVAVELQYTGNNNARLSQTENRFRPAAVQKLGRNVVVIVQYFVKHIGEPRFGIFLLKVQQLLPDRAFPAVVADMHFIVTADGGIRAHNMTEQAGVGPHMAQQEYVCFWQRYGSDFLNFWE